MSTTSITNGTDFIGKTLIIGSTALIDGNLLWARIFDFNNGSTNQYIIAPFIDNYDVLRFSVHAPNGGYFTQVYKYKPAIETYYIYVISFVSDIQLKVNVYVYNNSTSTIITTNSDVKIIDMPNTALPGLKNFWLGRSIYPDPFYNGRYDKVALYNGDLFALSDANILSNLLTLVTSPLTNIINNSTTYTFRALGTNFLGVVVDILNYNTTTGSTVTTSNITLIGTGSTSGGYLNIIGYTEPYNLNTPNKKWNMYLNTLSSISGDDLTIKPDTRRNLLLEVSGNNNIFIKKGDVSYNLTNLIRGDISFANVDVSNNLNPLISTVTQTQGTGGTITISGGYIIHSFTTTGTFAFIPAFSGNVEVLVVGGGGGGGGSIGGGGGGGGVIYMPSVSVISGISYEVVVGDGGTSGTKGNVSRFFDASAAGGGTSGQHDDGIGTAGGSGGGAASNNSSLNQGGASSGNSLGPNRGFIYGNRGGNMTTSRTVLLSGPSRAAGGGGAGGRAVDTDPNIIGDTGQTGAGSGGVGITNSILGTTYYWGGGGGGGSSQTIGSWGGLGGGGGGGGADSGGAGLGGGSALTIGAN